MRGFAGIVVVAASGCYTPHAATGSPCSPVLDNCPAGQSCQLVNGASICVEGTAIADAARDASIDTTHAIDAAPDAQVSAWTLVQTSSSTTPSAAVSATGGGHLIVVAVQFSVGGQVQLVTDTAGTTYTAVPDSIAQNANSNLAVQLWYAANSNAGAMQVATSTTSFRGIVVWEVAGMRTTNALDVAATSSNEGATTTPAGAAVTTTAAGDFVVSAAIVQNNVSGIHGTNEFTNDEMPNGNGFAHLTAARAPAGVHQARWDQPTSGAYCSSTAAFFVGP